MDSAENIVIDTEYWLKVTTIHILSDQSNGVEHYREPVHFYNFKSYN